MKIYSLTDRQMFKKLAQIVRICDQLRDETAWPAIGHIRHEAFRVLNANGYYLGKKYRLLHPRKYAGPPQEEQQEFHDYLWVQKG